MSLPPKSILHKIANEAYETAGKKDVDGFQLVFESPTIKFYKQDNVVVVGIRGTWTANDAKADSSIALGRLEYTDRFKTDFELVSDFVSRNPSLKYYGVGHSLGGAILDLFIKKGLISEGISYNPAVQPQDIRSSIPNHRIYARGDPLYLLMGRFLKDTPEVRDTATGVKKYLTKLPFGNVVTAGDQHALSNFTGGVCNVCGGSKASGYVSKLLATKSSSKFDPKMVGHPSEHIKAMIPKPKKSQAKGLITRELQDKPTQWFNKHKGKSESQLRTLIAKELQGRFIGINFSLGI